MLDIMDSVDVNEFFEVSHTTPLCRYGMHNTWKAYLEGFNHRARSKMVYWATSFKTMLDVVHTL
jgi:hypothetical protein